MPTELYEEWRKSHERSKGDWHPSYQEYWQEHRIDGCEFTHACAGHGILPQQPVLQETRMGEYFDNLNATLWGRAWDMSQPESVEGAKRWLMGVLTALGVEVVE